MRLFYHESSHYYLVRSTNMGVISLFVITACINVYHENRGLSRADTRVIHCIISLVVQYCRVQVDNSVSKLPYS